MGTCVSGTCLSIGGSTIYMLKVSVSLGSQCFYFVLKFGHFVQAMPTTKLSTLEG